MTRSDKTKTITVNGDEEHVLYEDLKLKIEDGNFDFHQDFEYLSDEQMTDAICDLVIEVEPGCLAFMPEARKTYDRCLQAAEYGNMIRYMPESLIDEKIALRCVQTDADILKLVPKALLTTEICRQAFLTDTTNIVETPHYLINDAFAQDIFRLDLKSIHRVGFDFDQALSEKNTSALTRLLRCLKAVPIGNQFEVPADPFNPFPQHAMTLVAKTLHDYILCPLQQEMKKVKTLTPKALDQLIEVAEHMQRIHMPEEHLEGFTDALDQKMKQGKQVSKHQNNDQYSL